jgi:hypothetical protein
MEEQPHFAVAKTHFGNSAFQHCVIRGPIHHLVNWRDRLGRTLQNDSDSAWLTTVREAVRPFGESRK